MLGVLVVATLLARVATAESADSAMANRCLSCHGMPNLVVRESAARLPHEFSVSPSFASS
jgi:hypothetical protein